MFIRPLVRGQVTCEWQCYTGHTGIDFQDVNNFTAPILAAASGTVTQAGVAGGYGNRVVIRHNIKGQTYYTLYAHISCISVRVGDQISSGQTIGNKGTTGNVQLRLCIDNKRKKNGMFKVIHKYNFQIVGAASK